jgi:hypothetical protein
VSEFDLVGNIMAFESGDLSTKGVLDLFAHLIETGTAWSLQGSYGRAANNLIDRGFISEHGDILVTFDDEKIT